MSGDHRSTTLHNIGMLTKDLGLKKDGNTSLFYRDDLLVFSPAVDINSQGKYWFDIREVNIKRAENLSPKICLLLVRIVPNKFIVCPFEQIQNICEAPKKEKSGNKKWSFLLVEDFSKIKNRHSDAVFFTHVLDKRMALDEVKRYCSDAGHYGKD